jgi:enoyl-CoA hydratase/carnithine racemase
MSRGVDFKNEPVQNMNRFISDYTLGNGEMEKQILVTRHEKAGTQWTEIILNRPDKGNAINMEMLDDLSDISSELKRDRAVRAVVLRARGRFFCTGGDIEAWGNLTPHDMGRDWILRGIEIFEQIANLPQPVIATINGHALGGGLELVMAADLRVAVQQAKFGNPEAKLGMIPGWMGTTRLAEMIGPARARHILLTATPITAQQAYEWGLITAMAEDEEGLDRQVSVWLNALLANGPSAMALIKGLLSQVHRDLRAHHAAAVAQAAGTEDCKEGVRAFIEKRSPIYRNR